MTIDKTIIEGRICVIGHPDEVSALCQLMKLLYRGGENRPSWYAELVDALGGVPEAMTNARGCWFELEQKDDDMLVWKDQCETYPATDVYRLIQSKYPSLTVLFMARDVDCDVFVTNDVEHERFAERFVLSVHDGEAWHNSIYEGESEVCRVASGILKLPIDTLDQLKEVLARCNSMTMSEVEYVDLEAE